MKSILWTIGCTNGRICRWMIRWIDRETNGWQTDIALKMFIVRDKNKNNNEVRNTERRKKDQGPL